MKWLKIFWTLIKRSILATIFEHQYKRLSQEEIPVFQEILILKTKGRLQDATPAQKQVFEKAGKLRLFKLSQLLGETYSKAAQENMIRAAALRMKERE